MNRRVAFCLLFLSAALMVPATYLFAADDPYLIKKRDFKKSVKTLAIAPVDAPAALGLSEDRAIQIENEIARLLEDKKYQVIRSSEYRALRESMAEQVGGTEDSDRVRAVREHSYREMLHQHDHDGTVMVKVEMVRADFKNDMADWDGTRQKVKWKGRGNYETTILATSIEITIFDRTSKAVFTNNGGLEVLMERVKTSFVPIPKENYFKDGKRLQQSVALAVDPL